MSTRKQWILSAVLVLGAFGVVGAWTLTRRADPVQAGTPGDMQGHVHGAGPAGGDELQPVRLDEESARRIGVTYATAEVKPLIRTLGTVGNVTYDETRLVNVNPKIEGWVERLHVGFTGAPVREGQPLLEVYSPMLVAAQEELILARRLVDQAATAGGERAASNARDLLESARRRLRYWDVPDAEIRRIEESGTPSKTLVLDAPASGIVVEKTVVEGTRIMPGMDVFKIADLTRVWVEGEVFEKDLSLVRLGQEARVSFEAYPGEVFRGRVTYVYPTVSVEARTGRIRLELANPDLRLKPGMYARVELAAEEGRTGLMIPRSAVHFTGERSLVFVRGEGAALIPREITPGLVSGSEVEVLAGLEEGTVVVSSANFLIDAEANMGASMTGMEGIADVEGGGTETPSPTSADPPGQSGDRGAAPATSAAHPGHGG